MIANNIDFKDFEDEQTFQMYEHQLNLSDRVKRVHLTNCI